jgi:hypothetical protein
VARGPLQNALVRKNCEWSTSNPWDRRTFESLYVTHTISGPSCLLSNLRGQVLTHTASLSLLCGESVLAYVLIEISEAVVPWLQPIQSGPTVLSVSNADPQAWSSWQQAAGRGSHGEKLLSALHPITDGSAVRSVNERTIMVEHLVLLLLYVPATGTSDIHNHVLAGGWNASWKCTHSSWRDRRGVRTWALNVYLQERNWSPGSQNQNAIVYKDWRVTGNPIRKELTSFISDNGDWNIMITFIPSARVVTVSLQEEWASALWKFNVNLSSSHTVWYSFHMLIVQ